MLLAEMQALQKGSLEKSTFQQVQHAFLGCFISPKVFSCAVPMAHNCSKDETEGEPRTLFPS